MRRAIYWNNATPVNGAINPGVKLDLVTTTGQKPGIFLEVASGFKKAIRVTAQSGEAIYPWEATDRWMVPPKEPGVLLLRGLRVGESYTLRIYATRNKESSGESFSKFTVGNSSQELQTVENLKDQVIFRDVKCEPDGTLRIMVSPGSHGQGIISVLEIQYGDPGAVPTQQPGTTERVSANSPAAPTPPKATEPKAPAAPPPRGRDA
ncbi:MAG: hypothetical protein HC901_03130, partial [Bdellovibrionaceae bacterium]|nr:hypothetical protein [Pseudobdellovibrionaceae bacterium]